MHLPCLLEAGSDKSRMHGPFITPPALDCPAIVDVAAPAGRQREAAAARRVVSQVDVNATLRVHRLSHRLCVGVPRVSTLAGAQREKAPERFIPN